MTYATVSSLERENEQLQARADRLENDIRKLQGKPSLEEEAEARWERIADPKAEEVSPLVATLRTAQLQLQGEREWWLEAAGVSPDADETLKRLALAHRQLNIADQAIFARLALATAGKKGDVELPGIAQTLAAWKDVPVTIRSHFLAVMEAYQGCVIKNNRLSVSLYDGA